MRSICYPVATAHINGGVLSLQTYSEGLVDATCLSVSWDLMDQDLATHAILVVVVILYKNQHVFVNRACSSQCSSILMMNSDSERSHVTVASPIFQLAWLIQCSQD